MSQTSKRGRTRRRRWRRRVDPLTHGLCCPACGATFGRHGRGGKRACKQGPVAECKGIECTCHDWKKHFRRVGDRLVWRRSPCPSAVCHHCGWTGMLGSIDYERTYKLSRCVATENGCHDAVIVARPSDHPEYLSLRVFCRACGHVGDFSIDPVQDIYWRDSAESEMEDEFHGNRR